MSVELKAVLVMAVMVLAVMYGEIRGMEVDDE